MTVRGRGRKVVHVVINQGDKVGGGIFLFGVG